MSFLGHPRGAEWSFGDKVITPSDIDAQSLLAKAIVGSSARWKGYADNAIDRTGVFLLAETRADVVAGAAYANPGSARRAVPRRRSACRLCAGANANALVRAESARALQPRRRRSPAARRQDCSLRANAVARGRACAWPSHACLSGPVGNGDVTTPSRMEQSVEAVGGPSRLVQRDTAQTDGLRARNALRSSGVGSGAACASGRIHAAASAGAGVCLSFEGARPWSSALRVGRSGSGRRNLESGRL
jgi:hypothetical protein